MSLSVFSSPISILNNQQFQRALFDPVQFPSGASWKVLVSADAEPELSRGWQHQHLN